jgi:uncharacterized protein YlzI (FlbEa/FlbD family)
MRFIEVHEFDSGDVVLINVNKIDIIYHMDDRTILRIEQTDLSVRENVHEILLKIRG